MRVCSEDEEPQDMLKFVIGLATALLFLSWVSSLCLLELGSYYNLFRWSCRTLPHLHLFHDILDNCGSKSGRISKASPEFSKELLGMLKGLAASEKKFFARREAVFGDTALHSAALFKMFDFLDEMVDLGHGVDFERDNNAGESVLDILRGVKDPNEQVKAIVDKLEASRTSPVIKGYKRLWRTPIHEAINKHSFKIVFVMSLLGGNWSSKDADGLTVLECLAKNFVRCNCNIFLKKWLAYAADDNNQTLLHAAIKHGNSDLFYLLIQNGADVNARLVDTGLTPLHYCAKYNRPEFAQVLVQKNKAKVDVLDFDKKTPLSTALECDSAECAGILLDMNKRDDVRNQSAIIAARQLSIKTFLP